MSKHIVIIGLGGVGGYFGFKINEAKEQNRVSFVARGTTFQKVQSDGLTLLSPEHPHQSITHPDEVCENINQLHTPDLVIIAVKEYDLEKVCQELKSVIGEHTMLLAMMNGVDIYDRIRSIIPNNTILPACVYITSHIQSKGVVEHKGQPGKLVFGRDPQHLSTDIGWLMDWLERSGIVYSFEADPQLGIWKKFTLVASLALVSAKYNSSMYVAITDEIQKQETLAIIEEIRQVAVAKGIPLPDDIAAKITKITLRFPPEAPTSFQVDVHSGKSQTELELFAGAIMKYGKAERITTPATDKIYLELQDILSNR